MKSNEVSQIVLDNVHKLCAFKGEKIKDVEAYLDVTRGYFNKTKRCGSTLTIDNCVKLAKFFNVELSELCRPYKIVNDHMPIGGLQYNRML